MEIEKQKEFLIKTAFTATAAALIYIALKLLSGPLFPFAAAAALTVSIQRFVRKWSKKLRLKKKSVSVALVITIYVIVGALMIWAGYALYRQLTEFIKTLPEYSVKISQSVSKISEKINGYKDRMPEFAGGLIGGVPEAALDSAAQKAASYLAGAAASFAAGAPFFLLSLVVMIIASAYLAKDYDEISVFIVRKLPKSFAEKLLFIKDVMLNKLVLMLRGYFIIMLMTFCELFSGLLLLRCRYALIIAAVTALIDILPVLGSGTVLIPWAVFCAVSGNPKRAAGLAVLYLVITVVRNITEPRIMGLRLGIHPVIMLISVFFGLTLFGAAGIILMPVTVVMIKSWVESRNDTGRTEAPAGLRGAAVHRHFGKRQA